MSTLLEKFKNNILPIYEQLLTNNSFSNVCTFCIQWGANFPVEKKKGILFVGKAVNGWISDETDCKQLFDMNNPDRIFARHDQMKWVEDLFDNKDPNGYKTKRSAFWRVIKKVAEANNPKEWYSHVAWSNLYKVSPWKGGNPNANLQNKQRKYCYELLKTEIETLSPEYVILLTSGWELTFLKYLNDWNDISPISAVKWGKYKTSLYNIKGTNFIVSQHPQGKSEWNHKNAILKLMEESKIKCPVF